MELIHVEDKGTTIIVTLRFQKRLAGYFTGILDNLIGIARQLHFNAKCAAAERRAILQALPNGSDPKEVTQVRNEMILLLSESGMKTEQIAEIYDLTPSNVRQIRTRLKKSKKTY